MYDLFAFIFQNSFLLRGCVLFVFGAIIGSFLNVVIYRLPIMLKHKWRDECLELLGEDCSINDEHIDSLSFNLIYPGSHCPVCKEKVPFWSNIPIFGYLLLRGKCYKCRGKISLRYPAIELLTGILFIIAGHFYNETVTLSACLVFISFIIVIMLIDYDTRILPDELTLLLLWLGLLFNLYGQIAGSLGNAVIGAVVGYVFLWLVFWIFKLITKRDGMGYGDFKLLAAILAFCGYGAISPVILIASVMGILYFMIGKLAGKFTYDHQIPFGTFLGIGGIIVLLGKKYLYIFSLN